MRDVTDSLPKLEAPPIKPADLIVPEDYKPHWREDMTEEAYHADKTAVGSSSVRLMLSSPKAFYEGHFLGKQIEETSEMRLGRIVHMAMLEGDKFKERYIVMPEFWGYTQKGERTNNPNCKEVKEQKAEWLAHVQPGQVVVTAEELEQITSMISSVLSHKSGRHVFAKGRTEVAGYYRDPKTGILCKIKPDFLGEKYDLITDFKTAQSCEMRLFGAKAFGPLRYDIQVVMYAIGTGIISGAQMPRRLVFMVVEKKWPFEAAVYYMTDQQIDGALFDYNRAMARLKECIDTDTWPMRQQQMEPLYTPQKLIREDVENHEMELNDGTEFSID